MFIAVNMFFVFMLIFSIFTQKLEMSQNPTSTSNINKGLSFTPSNILFGVIIGLLSFIISSWSMFCNVKTSDKNTEVLDLSKSNNDVMFRPKSKSFIDAIYISPKFREVHEIEEYKIKKINKIAFFNLNPNIFYWIIFHSILISLVLSFLAYLKLSNKNKENNESEANKDNESEANKDNESEANKDNESEANKNNSLQTQTFVCIATIISVLVFILYIVMAPTNVLDGIDILKIFDISFIKPELVAGIMISIVAIFAIILIYCLFCILYKFPKSETKNENATKNIANFDNSLRLELNKDASGDYLITIKDVGHIPTIKRDQEQEQFEVFNRFNFIALCLSLLVSASVLGTAIQRNMILEQVKGIGHLYPNTFTYCYGILFSFLLSLILIPSYIYFNLHNKKILGDDIGLKNSLEILKLITTVLLPMLTSLAQLFLTP